MQKKQYICRLIYVCVYKSKQKNKYEKVFSDGIGGYDGCGL